MSITFKELLMGIPLSDIEIAHQHNLEVLVDCLNIIRNAYGKPMIPTSVYRTEQKHKDIYRAKGIPDNKIPWGSAHLSGEAADISDPHQELQTWILADQDILDAAGLYCEDFSATPNWVHFQSRPFKSYKPGGTRFFKP